MSSIRVGIDASTLGPGGAATHLSEMLAAAQPTRQGVRHVTVWCAPELARLLPTREWLSVSTPRMLGGWRRARPLWGVASTPAIRAACDVLYIPGGLYLGGFTPFVAMSRNLLPFDIPERERYGVTPVGLRLRALAVLQTRTFRRARGTIFLTETAREVVQRRTGALPRSTIVPHGVSTQFMIPPRPQRPLSSYDAHRPFRLLYVSVLERYKHHAPLARAVAALGARGLPLVLDLVGPRGPTLPVLEQTLREVDPDGRFVRYHGPVDYTALPEWYGRADAAVFASSCENMPNTLLEMMAAGLPIACSSRGVMPEVFSDSGPTFDPEDVASVTGAVERLCADPDLRARSASIAHARAATFTWERCAESTFSFLVAAVS